MDVKAYTEYFRRMAAGELKRGPRGYYYVKREKSPPPKVKLNIQHITPWQAALERAKGQVKIQQGGVSKKRKFDFLE